MAITLLLTLAVIVLALRVARAAFVALRLDPWDLLLYFGLAEHPAPPVTRRTAASRRATA